MSSKVNFKDILNVTVTDAKKSVQTLTDKQLEAMLVKVERFHELTLNEYSERYLEEESEPEINDEV